MMRVGSMESISSCRSRNRSRSSNRNRSCSRSSLKSDSHGRGVRNGSIRSNRSINAVDWQDIHGQFHPIAVAIMKRERDDDFSWFLNGIKCFCLQFNNLNIESKIEHFMIDGSGAEFKAIEINFPKAKITMCWFHVTKCVRDWCKENGLIKRQPNLCKTIMDDINDLHHTLSFNNFCEELRRIELKWSQIQEL
jgi:hypothetical protein